MNKHKRERLRIVRELDVDAAIAAAVAAGHAWKVPTDRTIALAGLHKARVNAPGMTPEHVAESKLWLLTNGYTLTVKTTEELRAEAQRMGYPWGPQARQ